MLGFSAEQVRNLITADSKDRLGKLLVDCLLAPLGYNPFAALAEYIETWKVDDYYGDQYKYRTRAKAGEKIPLIKLVREFSRDNKQFSEILPHRKPWGTPPTAEQVWGLAEAKAWVEHNLEQILAALK